MFGFFAIFCWHVVIYFAKCRWDNKRVSLIVKWLSPLTLNQESPVRIRVGEHFACVADIDWFCFGCVWNPNFRSHDTKFVVIVQCRYISFTTKWSSPLILNQDSPVWIWTGEPFFANWFIQTPLRFQCTLYPAYYLSVWENTDVSGHKNNNLSVSVLYWGMIKIMLHTSWIIWTYIRVGAKIVHLIS